MHLDANMTLDTTGARIATAGIFVFRAPAPEPGAPLPFQPRPGAGGREGCTTHEVRAHTAWYRFLLDIQSLADTSLPLFYYALAFSWNCKPFLCTIFYKNGGGGTLSERAPGTREFFQALIDDLADFPKGWNLWTVNEPFIDFVSQEKTDARTA